MSNATLKSNLLKIEEWLSENAPKIVSESLNPPATIEQLDELEKTLSKPLPQDFKELFLWHNGLTTDDSRNTGNLFYGLDLFNIGFIRENYIEVRDSQEDKLYIIGNADVGINPTNHRNPLWLKFGYDWSRCSLAIDLNPIDPQHYGQVIFIDYDYHAALLVANSIEDLVQTFLSDLQQGLYFLNEEALENEDQFLDTKPEIDLLNWKSAKENQRWKRDFS